MGRTADTIADLDAQLDALAEPTSDEVYRVSQDYDADLVAASAARRAINGGGGGAGGGWPIRDFIIGYHTPKAHSGFGHVDPPQATQPELIPTGVRYCDNADGSWVEWYVALAAGTYTLGYRGFDYDGAGILTFSLDGTPINQAPHNASTATYDAYKPAGNGYTIVTICSDLVIPTSGIYTLRVTVTGKNASSSGYVTDILWLYFSMVSEP